MANRGGDRHRQSASYANSYSGSEYRRASRTRSCDAKGHQSKESAHHYCRGPNSGRDQQESDNRQHSSGREAHRRVERRLDWTSRDGSHAELVTRMCPERIRSRESFGDLVGQLEWKPTFDIDRGQFLLLGLWMGLQLAALLFEVGPLNVSLRADRNVFACSHRHGAGNQCGYGRCEHETRRSSSCNYSDRNARDRNNSIIGAEHGCSQPPGALSSVTNSSDGTHRAQSIDAWWDPRLLFCAAIGTIYP